MAATSRPGTRELAGLQPGEQAIVLDEAGQVVAVDDGAAVTALDIETGRRLWEQVRGLSPQLVDLLANGRRDDQGELVAVLEAPGSSREVVHVRLRALPRERERSLALSLCSPEQAAVAGESPVELRDHLDAVARLVALASTGGAPKETAAAILALLVERTGLDTAALYILREYPLATLLTAYGKTRRRGIPYPPVDCSHPLLAPLLHGTPLITLGSGLHDLPSGLEDACARHADQYVLAPAAAGGAVHGMLVLSCLTQRRIGTPSLHLVMLAAQVLALISQRALASAESEVTTAVMETAYAVARTISRSLDVAQTARIVTSNAARLVRGTRCLLAQLDADADELVVIASSTGDVDLTGARLRLDLDGTEELRGRGHLEVDVSDLVWGSPAPGDVRETLDIRRALFLSMVAEDEPIGALVLLAPKGRRPFSSREIKLAEEVAEQAAGALHNARLYRDLADSRQHIEALMARMGSIRETERRELAGIVHDDIIQTVVGTVYKLEAARDDLPAESQEPISAAIRSLQGTIDDARRVISDLRPPALEGVALPASLKMLVDRADSQGPARVGIDLDDLPELESGKAGALYRILREALVNAQRHAGARRVWVVVRAVPAAGGGRELRLSVRDDGRGLTPRGAGAEEHFGLAMMEEQAALAGGTFSIESAGSRGVVVKAVIPL